MARARSRRNPDGLCLPRPTWKAEPTAPPEVASPLTVSAGLSGRQLCWCLRCPAGYILKGVTRFVDRSHASSTPPFSWSLGLGCSNKIPQTGRLRQRKFISYSSGVWEVQGQGPGRLDVWRGPSSCFLDGHLVVVTSAVAGVRELSGVPFIRAPIQFMRPHPHDLIKSPTS